VTGDHIAFVPLVTGQKRTIHPSTVQIRSADTGTLLATASWNAGRPRAIAVTRQRLAVLINQGNTMRIAIFSTATGNQLANYPVTATIRKDLQMSSAGVMFQTDISRPQLRLLDPTTGARRTSPTCADPRSHSHPRAYTLVGISTSDPAATFTRSKLVEARRGSVDRSPDLGAAGHPSRGDRARSSWFPGGDSHGSRR
jgi:hypothetical protein